jgi:peroxiredoxin
VSARQAAIRTTVGERLEVWDEAQTAGGRMITELSRERPVLVVFLRHFGCAFCREAVAQLARERAEIEASGTQLAFVHMGSDDEARAFFARYGLPDVERVGDPDQHLYRAARLGRGAGRQLLSAGILRRGVSAALHGHLAGRVAGDARQLPGVFLVVDGETIREFRHTDAAQRPDYLELAACPLPAEAVTGRSAGR